MARVRKYHNGGKGPGHPHPDIQDLLTDLTRFGKEGGARSDREMMWALDQLAKKRVKYESDLKDVERSWNEADQKHNHNLSPEDEPMALSLFRQDPSRLQTFYEPGSISSQSMTFEDKYLDKWPTLGFGTAGAGISYPEHIKEGERPKYILDSKYKTGQRLVGKYVRDDKGTWKVQGFDKSVIDLLNKPNLIKYNDGGNIPKDQKDVKDLLSMLSNRHSVSRSPKEVKQRKGVRPNEDGTESTHLMRTETLDGENWFSFPSLFQDEDGGWVDMSQDEDWMGAYKEAQKRGEVYDFGKDKEKALAFGEGSWKDQLKPNSTDILSSLVSESTQPSGYTPPQLKPKGKGVDLIPKPLTNEEMFGAITPMYEGQNPNTAWMYNAMNNMPPAVAKKWREENPGTSPEGINMMGVLGAAGYSSLGVVIPGTRNITSSGWNSKILGYGGVTIGEALNAYFFKEGIEGGIKHIPEFMDDPSWSGANDITWDVLKVLPGMQGLKNNVLKPFVESYKKAKKATAATSTFAQDPLQQLARKKPLSNPQTNQPIVFYHGTSKSAGDKILAEGFTGQTSLMNRRDFAQNYATSGPRTSGDKAGTIIESHVTLNNPMNSQQNIALREKIIGEIAGKSLEELASPGYGMTPSEWQKYDAIIQKEFIKRAKELGYDGIYDVNQPEILVFDPSSIKVVGSSSIGGDPLQQLAGKPPKVKGKGKKYEPVNTYEESNVAVSTNSAGSQEIRGLENYTVNEQISVIRKSIAKLKEAPVTQSPALFAKNLAGLERDLKLALEHKAGRKLNPGVYQYPSFLEGSKIQGQVSKDGTIARSTLEQLVKNTNTKKSEAFAIESTLSKFEGKRVPYSDFKKALASSIQPAEVTKTKDYSNVGVKNLGYENVDLNIEDTAFMTPEEVASIDAKGNFSNGPSTKTSLYKDPAFPSSTSHFDNANSFWIRSLVSKLEPKVFHVTEMQTDVPSLTGQWDTKNIPASEEINIFLTENGIGPRGQKGASNLPDPTKNINSQKHYILTEIKRIKDGTIQGWEIEALQKKIDRALPILNNPRQLKGRIGPNQTVDQVILEMTESVKNLELEIKGTHKKHEDLLVLYEKALEMVPNAIKNSPALAKQKRDAKGMPLRYINEALLDAGRGGQTVLRMPTPETVFTIEGWNSTPNIDRGLSEEAKRKMTESQATITKRYKDFVKLWKNEFGTEVRSVTGPKGNTWYEVDVPKKFIQTDPSKPLSEIKTYKRGGALKGLVKKYGAGGSVNGWGAQGNFTTEYSSRQPEVAQLPPPTNLLTQLPLATLAPPEAPVDNVEKAGMGGYDEAIMASKSDQAANKIVDSVPIFKMFKALGEGATNLIVGDSTGEKRKKRQKWAALFTSPHKLLAMRKADKSGDYQYAEEEEETLTPQVENDFWAKDGMKIKKNPLYKNGGIFDKMRGRRAERRIAKTPVRDADSSDLLDMLDNYKESVGVPAGQYDPKDREIVMFKDDPDTLEHEKVHATQYGPLQRLAYRVDSDRSVRIQDPTTRKSYRKLTSGKDMVDDRTFNDAGQFILGKGEEFEAVVGTGVNAAKEKGVNFNLSFEEILSQLKNIPSPTNNMRGLMKFMSNKFTKEQRDLILKSIR